MKFKKLLLLVQRVVLSPAAFWRYVVHYARLYQYNDLLQFAGEEGSDKGSPGHNYVRVYDAFLRDRRDSVTHLCEIGLLRLGVQKQAPAEVYPKAPSLNMWRKYLPHTHLVGFDIQRFETPRGGNCTVIQGDQSSREDLQKIIKHHPEYDVIIDDALHASPHQQITLSYLFPHLKSGGLYFVEDLNGQPPEFEREGVPKTVEVLRKFASSGVWTSPLSTPEEKRALERGIHEIYFFESLRNRNPVVGVDTMAVIIKR